MFYDFLIAGLCKKYGKFDGSSRAYAYKLSWGRAKTIRDLDLIFDDERQKTDSGGSGCGCSAVVTCGYFYKRLMRKEIKSLLLISTGALMSTTSSLQGETIPGIAHAVAIEYK